jgi:hypothetical protein
MFSVWKTSKIVFIFVALMKKLWLGENSYKRSCWDASGTHSGEIYLSGKTNRKFLLGYGNPPLGEYSVVDYKLVAGICGKQKFSEISVIVCTGTWGYLCAHLRHPYFRHAL